VMPSGHKERSNNLQITSWCKSLGVSHFAAFFIDTGA